MLMNMSNLVANLFFSRLWMRICENILAIFLNLKRKTRKRILTLLYYPLCSTSRSLTVPSSHLCSFVSILEFWDLAFLFLHVSHPSCIHNLLVQRWVSLQQAVDRILLEQANPDVSDSVLADGDQIQELV